ncbi:hypothetical protein FYJ84_09540 [Veillonellaceae bacterium WCA-693-APC-5D-A]|uniref:Uncharacterized protein n=1 Tax=Anaerovibrio slackiae TaxID=2652309 RepID=A0A6I2UKI8_9FIRM|nr:hypothetical protein [Anaerovibrio slackiae]MSU09226.1 hypothetical protein [Anaerovibrio slackiae]
MMNELELRETLSNKTVDVLVETIVRLLRLISQLEMEVQVREEDKKYAGNNRINGIIDNIVGTGDGSRA